MSEVVIVAMISLIGTLGGTFGGIVASGKLTTFRIEQLETKVEKHNSVIEKTYALQESIKIQEEKLKVANHRLDDLEKKVG